MPIFIGPQSSTSGVAYRAPLLSGEAGTAQTIKLMRQLVDQAVGDASFVRQAIEIVRTIPAYDHMAEAQRLYEWVSQNIRYTMDPVTKEKLYRPQDLLKIRAGDCDDISMLLGALAIAIGMPARLITISANAERPEEFSHVYLEVEVPPGSGMWIPMDAARPSAQFAEEPPMYYRKRAWSLTDDSYQDLNGFAGCDCGCGSSSGSGRIPCLGGYATLEGYDGLGQDGFDWTKILTQGIQEVPQIIAVTSGQPSSVVNPYGQIRTGQSPYGSFETPYTPGYGLPQAGYGSPSYATSWLSANWPIVGLGLLALMMIGKRS